MFSNIRNVLIILILLIAKYSANAENDYFSSISGLENLFQTEAILLKEMQNYLHNLQIHIEILQSELNTIEIEHNLASNDFEGYLNNPINSYRLIKRLYTDWPTFEEAVTHDDTRTNYLNRLELQKQNLSFPTEEDMFGSTMALVRIQKTYQLNVEQVASGILNGVKYGTSMSWQDCFSVGEYLFAMKNYNDTLPWLKQTTEIVMKQSYRNDEPTLDFLENIAEYYITLGDISSAINLIDYITSQDRTRHEALAMKIYLEQIFNNGSEFGFLYEKQNTNYYLSKEFKLYEKVCRGKTGPAAQTNLKCFLFTNNNPYRILQPYKVEQLSEDPHVLYVHQIITEKQCETIKELAKPKMKRSEVKTDDGMGTTMASYRTSKTAWFSYGQNKYLGELLQHVADLSGLDVAVNSAEDLQVANYGLGGHYEPHFDFFTTNNSYTVDDGNRISTAMFYLENVEDGGGTAFPFLDLLVKPEKGSLLFWYNLHATGHEDYRTKHAACPVLKGSKWIANIWLRERSQFLRRPCNFIDDHEISLPYENYD